MSDPTRLWCKLGFHSLFPRQRQHAPCSCYLGFWRDFRAHWHHAAVAERMEAFAARLRGANCRDCGVPISTERGTEEAESGLCLRCLFGPIEHLNSGVGDV